MSPGGDFKKKRVPEEILPGTYSGLTVIFSLCSLCADIQTRGRKCFERADRQKKNGLRNTDWSTNLVHVPPHWSEHRYSA